VKASVDLRFLCVMTIARRFRSFRQQFHYILWIASSSPDRFSDIDRVLRNRTSVIPA
jgi:hypothetical protein